MKTAFAAVLILAAHLIPASAYAQGGSVGDGVAAYTLMDYEAARAIWLPLAEAGEAEAQFRLALLYELGLGVDQSDELAFGWHQAAALQGHAGAQFVLGRMYASGQGTEIDIFYAFDWILNAAEGGEVRAQYYVATLYLTGEGIEPSILEAYIWFTRVANSGTNGPELSRASEAVATLEDRLTPDELMEALRRIYRSES